MIFLVNTERHTEVTEDEIDSIRCSVDAGYGNTPRDLVLCHEQYSSPSFPLKSFVIFLPCLFPGEIGGFLA